MNHLFVSYAKEDQPFVKQLVRALTAQERDVWIDWQENMPFSTRRLVEIYAAIEAAGAMLLVWSPAASAAANCRRELAHALKHNKRVIALVCPPALPEEIPGVTDMAHICPADPSADCEPLIHELVQILRVEEKWVQTHTRLLVRANAWDRRGRDGKYLLKPGEVRHAENWLLQSADKPLRPTPLQTQYIVASRQAAAQRQKIWWMGTAACLIFALTLLLTTFSRLQIGHASPPDPSISPKTSPANSAEYQAILARQLAAQAEIVFHDNRPIQGALLALESIKRMPLPTAQQTLQRSLQFLPRPAARLSHTGPVLAAAYSPNGQWLATATADGHIRIWNTYTYQIAFELALGEPISSLAFDAGGTWLASGSQAGIAQVWDVTTGIELTHMRHPAGVKSVTFSPDGKWLATASDLARVWSIASGQEIARLGNNRQISGITFSPDGRWLATGDSTGTVQLHTVATGEIVASMEHAGPINAVLISPDQRYLLTGSADGTTRVWELPGGTELMRLVPTRATNPIPVTSVALHPSGKWVITAGPDGAAWIWEALSGRTVGLMAHAHAIHTIAISPDGRWIATGSADYVVRIWKWPADSPTALPELPLETLINEACSRLPRNLTQAEWHEYLGDEPYRATCPELPNPDEPIWQG